MIKLNIGGTETREGGFGSPELKGFTNIDVRSVPGVDIVHNCEEAALPFHNGMVDEIRASHVIEHFHPKRLNFVIKDWIRVLKPGGILRIYCPDARKICEHLVHKRIPIDEARRLLFGNQTYGENLHRNMFDQPLLIGLVQKYGCILIGTNPRPNAYQYDMGIQAKKR